MSLQKRFKKSLAVSLPQVPEIKYDRWLGIKEAAAYAKIGRNTLRQLAAENKIPHQCQGGNGKLIFDRLDLDHYRETQKVGVVA